LPELKIIPFDSAELSKASLVIRKFVDQRLTLADAHGISVMRAWRNPVCWSTDRHLALGGARLVIGN
jgi:hypothetical protein